LWRQRISKGFIVFVTFLGKAKSGEAFWLHWRKMGKRWRQGYQSSLALLNNIFSHKL
jgi:hypothetical protein